jgi:SAM-dependent methyltransferase
MPAEFDRYARGYSELLKDPLRDIFAPGSTFFALRKWLLIQQFYKEQGRDTSLDRWLDVGCGSGELLRLARPHFRETQGCDISVDMIATALDLPIRVQSNPAVLPFEDESFDLVTAVCVFHHVENGLQADLISEIGRVLKLGGVACVIEHNPLNPVTQLIVRRAPIDVDAVLLSATRVQRLLAARFSIMSREYFLLLPEALYPRVGWLERILRRVPLGGQYAVFGCKTSPSNETTPAKS